MPYINGGGGAAFNGGTITNPVLLDLSDQSGSSIPLEVRGVGAIGDYDEAFRVTTSTASSHTSVMQVDSAYTTLNGSLLVNQNGSGWALQVVAGGGTKLSIDDTGKIGLFGHAAAAQPTLTSGTATPEQIALALQSYGVTGGT